MEWQKLGVLWKPSGDVPWAQTHATLPVVHAAAPDQWHIFLSTRDAANKSRIGRLRVDKAAVTSGATPTVRGFDSEPVLSLGDAGTFDDSGVMPSWLTRHGDQLRLYYIGWNVIATVPYRVSIGLAVSDDNGATFRRYSQGPVLDRSHREPFFATTPCVLHENGQWRMWYASCTGWRQIDNRWEPSYHVKYAESPDGIDWTITGVSCIGGEEGEAVCRPCVWRRGNSYAMLYSYRSLVSYRTERWQGYRLGYAESVDGVRWERLDDRAGIALSADGWDSMMQEYCWVQPHNGETYLFYNGNGFGLSGFGVARLIKSADAYPHRP